eukprot:8968371-Karenia_brevis.AAC.1
MAPKLFKRPSAADGVPLIRSSAKKRLASTLEEGQPKSKKHCSMGQSLEEKKVLKKAWLCKG